MNFFMTLLSDHAGHAHWLIFFGALLAGCNIPISIDLLVLAAAVIAARFVPEHTLLLYSFLVTGCIISAWIAFGIGKIMGPKLRTLPFFRSFLSEKKMDALQNFYKRNGPFTFLIGRCIPFGVRNALFLSSGMSGMPFLRFVILDGTACLIWASVLFFLFFRLGQNFETLWMQVKIVNGYIFAGFSVVVIGIFWYKKTKRIKT